MAIQLARVDDRLLHDQVTLGWIKSVRPNRILIVSDRAAHADLHQLVQQAAPTAVPVTVISVTKMVQIYRDARFDGLRPLILTETLPAMAELVAQGIDLQPTGVNLGNLANLVHKTALTPSVAVNDGDVQAALAVQAAGVNVYLQPVPGDQQLDFLEVARQNGLTR